MYNSKTCIYIVIDSSSTSEGIENYRNSICVYLAGVFISHNSSLCA